MNQIIQPDYRIVVGIRDEQVVEISWHLLPKLKNCSEKETAKRYLKKAYRFLRSDLHAKKKTNKTKEESDNGRRKGRN